MGRRLRLDAQENRGAAIQQVLVVVPPKSAQVMLARQALVLSGVMHIQAACEVVQRWPAGLSR